jgi:AcrR family transcriptional regulator
VEAKRTGQGKDSYAEHRAPGRSLAELPLNKHQKKSAATKQKLLKAARRIFARDGFDGSRIDDIAAEAGYTRGAFYAHFKTKEDLFFALLEQQAGSKMEEVRRMLEACQNEEEKLLAIREYHAKRLSESAWSILVLEFKLYALRHPRLRAKLAAAHRRIRARMRLEEVARLFPDQLESSSRSRDLKRMVCEVLLNGIALEQAYDSEYLTEAEATSILRSAFDLLIRSKEL